MDLHKSLDSGIVKEMLQNYFYQVWISPNLSRPRYPYKYFLRPPLIDKYGDEPNCFLTELHRNKMQLTAINCLTSVIVNVHVR